MPDIANEKRPREDDDASAQSNPKRLREDFMQSEPRSAGKRRREENGDGHQPQERVDQSEASTVPSPKRRLSKAEPRASTTPFAAEDNHDQPLVTLPCPEPAQVDDQSDHLSEDSDENDDGESIILIDLTNSQGHSSSSRSRQNTRPKPRFGQSRDNYPPADSFPRVPYMDEQRGFQLPSMRAYVREYSRQNSQSTMRSSQQSPSSSQSTPSRPLRTSQSSIHGHYHVEVSDDEGASSDEESYHDPYHPWAQGPVQLIMNRHGIPPSNSALAPTAASVSSYARGITAQDCPIESRAPTRLVDTGSQGHRDAGVSLATAGRPRPQDERVDDDDDDDDDDDNNNHHHSEYLALYDGDAAGEDTTTQVDDTSIVAQGSDGHNRNAIMISDDSDLEDQEDDALSTQAQRSNDNRSPSPYFVHASRSPSPVRLEHPRAVSRPHRSSSPLLPNTDELLLPTRRSSHPEEQRVNRHSQQNITPPPRTSDSFPSYSFRVQPVPLILCRTPSAFTSFASSASQPRSQSFMNGNDSSSSPPRHRPHSSILDQERSQRTSPSPRHHVSGLSSASTVEDILYDDPCEVASPSSRSSVTETPTAAQATSHSRIITPNTTLESMFTAPGSHTPTADSPSSSVAVPLAPDLSDRPIVDSGAAGAASPIAATNSTTNSTTSSTINSATHPTKRSFISRLRCQICWDTPSIPTATQCGHVYCEGCIQQWLSVNRHCPVCRSNATNHSLQEMEFFVSTKSS